MIGILLQPDIQSVEAGDSDVNNNQIKKVYIESGGTGYANGTYDILGDGSGGRVSITVDSNGTITDTNVVTGGKGYTFGIVNLERTGTISSAANLILSFHHQKDTDMMFILNSELIEY